MTPKMFKKNPYFNQTIQNVHVVKIRHHRKMLKRMLSFSALLCVFVLFWNAGIFVYCLLFVYCCFLETVCFFLPFEVFSFIFFI